MAGLAWASYSLLTNESIVDDWLVSMAQQVAISDSDDGASNLQRTEVGVILVDDNALQLALNDPGIAKSEDHIANAYRYISGRLYQIIATDKRARGVVLDFYASPYTKLAGSVRPLDIDCQTPVVQVALPPPMPFGQEFVRPDPRFVAPTVPCAIIAYSFANLGAGQSKLRTIDHNPFPKKSGCPVISLAATAVALAQMAGETEANLAGTECQRQDAILSACKSNNICQLNLATRFPMTSPPDNLSVRTAEEFFDPAFAADALSWLHNRIVFIGSSNSLSDDYFYLADGSLSDALSLTGEPAGVRWPGVMLHAGLAQRMLDAERSGGKTIMFLGWQLSLVVGAIIALLATAVLRKRLQPFGPRHCVQWILLSLVMLLPAALMFAKYAALIVHFIYALVGVAIVASGIWVWNRGKDAHHSG